MSIGLSHLITYHFYEGVAVPPIGNFSYNRYSLFNAIREISIELVDNDLSIWNNCFWINEIFFSLQNLCL